MNRPMYAKLEKVLEKHDRLFLVLILLAGLVAIIGSSLGHSMLEEQISSSSWTIAVHLREGQGYSACARSYFPLCSDPTIPTAMREPVPVLLFLAVMTVFSNPLAGLLLEAALYIFMILLLYLSLRKKGQAFALVTAALWTSSVVVVQEIGDGSGDLEAAFLLACSLILFEKGRASNRLLHWALSGLFLVLAVLSRSVLMVLIPAFMLGILADVRLGSLASRMGQAAVLGTIVLAGLAPWVIRNQAVFGQPIVGTTLTGYNLYRQNYILQQPGWQPHYVGAREAGLAVKRLIGSNSPGRAPDEAQMQAYYQQHAFQSILHDPAGYLQLVVFRFFSLWFNSTVKPAYGEKVDFLDVVMVLQQLFLLGTLIVGSIKHYHSLWPYVVGIILTCAAYMAVTAQARYLVDIMPLIVVLSASGFLPVRADARRVRVSSAAEETAGSLAA